MLSSGSGISTVAHQLSGFGVGFSLCLITGGLFLCLSPFLQGKVSDLSAGPLLPACCNGLLIIFQSSVSFDFGCCSLAQEMSFVNFYLPYFRQQLITCLLSALLPFQPLFTESSHGEQLLASPPFSSVLSATLPLRCVLVFSSLFIIQVFLRGGRQSAQWAMLIYPRCGWGIPGDNVATKGIPGKKQTGWCSDDKTGGGDGKTER
jgi:hypothetical protein